MTRFVLVLSLAVTMPVAAHDLSHAPNAPVAALPPEILNSIDLGKEIPGGEGRTMRMRRVILEPGGAIPPHDHADRPAIVYIVQGKVREHRSDHTAPVEYGAGESIVENAAVHHWIENIGDVRLIGVVVDLVNDNATDTFTRQEILTLNGMDPHLHE